MVSDTLCTSIEKILDKALSSNELIDGIYDSVDVYPYDDVIDGMDVFVVDINCSSFDVGYGLGDDWEHDDDAYNETHIEAMNVIKDIVVKKLKAASKNSKYIIRYIAEFEDEDEGILSFQFGIKRK